jgi:chromosome segregation ATPase
VTESIIAAVVSLVLGVAGGAGFKPLLDYMTNRDKNNDEQKLKETSLPIDQYSALVDRLEKRITRLEDQHSDCLAQNAKLHGEIGRLEGRVLAQEAMISKWISESQKASSASAALSLRAAEMSERSAERSAAGQASLVPSKDNPVPVEIVKDSSDSGIIKGRDGK